MPKTRPLIFKQKRPFAIAQDRRALVARLINRCHRVYRNDPDDIRTFENTIETYLDPSNQLKYVHMYFAKHVGCWRRVRQRLGFPSDGPVWSIGAGPRLCLMGWFFDEAPKFGQKIVALDIAPWEKLRNLPEYTALRNHILQSRSSIQNKSPRFFPKTLPPQGKLLSLKRARPITPSELPSNATVLFPMVLNHVVGAIRPHPQRESVFSWLRAVTKRVRRVVIIDIQHDTSTDEFWTDLWIGIGLSAPIQYYKFTFNPYASGFQHCYSGKYKLLRTGLKYPQFCTLSGLVHTKKDGWRYFRDE